MNLFYSLCAYSLLTLCLFAQDYNPHIEPASDEGELAMQGFDVPEGIKVELFAAEPSLANPVAFCIDEQGRLYVCETFRQSKGVEDNRGHMNWLEADLSLTTIEERRQMFEKFLGEKVVDYTKEQDRIRLLTDTDGDGKADSATVFADGFNDAVDGTGAGVLAIDGDVFYTCIPKLYKFQDTDGDGVSDKQEVLSDGYGIRVAFRGHDMHGLVLGPDGRIYFSIGDRGFNVMTKEGNHLFHPDCGGVFRCELDGSNLELFAHGLRNPQELAFDNYGNLFTGDNNSDSGDQARWVHVVEGAEVGWRMYYQYLSDRGPWNRERIWYPYRADEQTTAVQPAYIVPPVINISDGPSGLVHYPGVGLSERYDNHFFLADFRGSAANSGIRSFAVTPKGASFELTDSHWFLQKVLATDVDFGYDGKMYVTDWVDGWNGPGKGRVYTFTDPEHQYRPYTVRSDDLMKEGLSERNVNFLAELLTHPDQRIRLRAQYELAKREESDVLLEVAKNSDNQLARLHGVWGLGQLLRHGKTDAKPVINLVYDADAEVGAQAIGVLADAHITEAKQAIMGRLIRGTPREQYFAAIALGKLKDRSALNEIIKLLEKNNNEDPVVRHAAVMGLVGTAKVEDLKTYFDHQSDAVRLGIVVALRRMQAPELAEFLNDDQLDVVVEAARAIHDLPVEEALDDLAAMSFNQETPDALARRILNANFRIGGSEAAERVAQVAADKRMPQHLREEAAKACLSWDAPPVLDRVTNEYRPLPERSLDEIRPAVEKHLAGILSGPDSMTKAGIELAAKLNIKQLGSELVTAFKNADNSTSIRVAALSALDAIKADNVDSLLDEGLSDQNDRVRAEAAKLLAKRNPDTAITALAKALVEGTRFERQSAMQVLGDMKSSAADMLLIDALDQYLAGTLPADVKLDLLEIANKRDAAEFAERVAKIEAARDASDPLGAFRECLEGGDSRRGYEIFFGNAAASCRRCHKIGDNGSDVGPALTEIGKKQPRDYLLESIVTPNAKIAKGFETVVFATVDGRVVSGIVKNEDDETYQLMKPMGELFSIRKDQIDAQTKGKSGMPDDLVKQLSKRDIRDLVEFLSILDGTVTGEGPGGHEG